MFLNNISIRLKLALLFFVLAAIPVFFIGFLSLSRMKGVLEKVQVAALEGIAELKVEKIETLFAALRKDMQIAQAYYNIKVNLPILTKYAKEETHPEYIAAKKALDSQLKPFQRIQEFFDFMLVNPEGKIVYVTNEKHTQKDLDNLLPDPGNKGFTEGEKGIYISDVFRNTVEGGKFTLLVTAPARSVNGDFIGVIAFEVDVAHIYGFITDPVGLGETGETLVVKNYGDYALCLNPLRFDKDAALKRKVIFGGEKGYPLQQAAQRRNGSGIAIDYNGREVIAAWRYIPSLDWGMVAKIETQEAFREAAKLLQFIILLGTGILILIGIIAWHLARLISAPLQKLTQTTQIISAGDLEYRVDIKGSDEIGQLAESFNKMTLGLKKSQDELKSYGFTLEKKVKERTEELEESRNNLEVKVAGRTRELEDAKKVLEKNVNELTKSDRAMLIMLEDLKQSKQVLAKKTEELEKSSSELRLSQLAAMNMLEDISQTKEALEKAQVELEKWNKTLEEKVETRTGELKEAQEKVARSEKLAAIGALSAGIGHELRNPLGAMKNACYYVKRKILMSDLAKEDQRIPEFLEIIENEIGASDKIITDLLTFSRTGRPAFRPSEVNTIIEGALYLAKIPQNIKVDKRLKPGLPKAMVDPDQIRQVFLNIILNAFQSMPEGGGLKIEEDQRDRFIEVRFTDSGCGIKQEDLDKIFEPLFTTKAKGIGLGLAVTKAIMEKHEGAIEVGSKVGEGTTFIIKLPVAGQLF